jgi:transposase
VTASPKAQRRLAVKKDTAPDEIIGIDIGDKQSVFCVLERTGEDVIEEGRVATTQKGLTAAFGRRARARVAIEAGTHSAWIADVLEELGHEVLVANPRELERITKSDRKNDRNDAELLARLARADPKLLSPIKHRPKEVRADLAVIRARDALVQTRTKLINAVRGLLKAAGERTAKCSASSFHKTAPKAVSAEMRPAIQHLVMLIKQTTEAITAHDHMIEELAQKKYGEVKLLTGVAGVGTLTALAFVLTIGDRDRFAKSRDVGAYFGLVPRQQQSSSADPQLRISKAGDGLVRKLLVCSAHYVLGHFGPDTDLRRWGLMLAQRGGKNGKKRAVVAVARKLAVLLHRLWVTGEIYEPLRPKRVKRTEALPEANATTDKQRSDDVRDSCGELRGRPTRVENPQKRPRKGGRVSHALPAHKAPHTSRASRRSAAAAR